jgi:pyruvate/2-oxoacid:ferredoxin oxidoreductase beta subunit
MAEILVNKYTPKDFKSDQEVRWCPGCGDHAVLNSVQKALVELDVPKEKFAFISGIGCFHIIWTHTVFTVFMAALLQ